MAQTSGAESSEDERSGMTRIDQGSTSVHCADNVTLVDDKGLRPVNSRPTMPKYCKQLWRRRHFVFADARSNTFSSARGMILGKFWIILDPLLQVLIYALVFGLVLQTSRGMDNFIGFLFIGVIFFKVVTKGMNTSTGLIKKSRALISSFNFPRAAVVYSTIIRNFLDDIPPAILAILVATLLQMDQGIPWTLLLVIPLYVLMSIFNLGLAFIVARATAFVPDLKSLVTVANRGLFFISGIFFSVERYATQPIIQEIMTANPIYQFLNAVRTCVLNGEVPDLGTWLYLTTWSLVLAVLGFVYFWQAEERYSNVK